MTFKAFSLACIATIALSGAALAHHSHANFDSNTRMTLTGTVTEYHWINPHVWVYMTVTGEDGEEQQWALEAGSIGQLSRGGWSRVSFESGDEITVTVHPLRDGSNGGLLGYIELADGTVLCDPGSGAFGDLDGLSPAILTACARR